MEPHFLMMLQNRSHTAEKRRENKKHAEDDCPNDDKRWNRRESPFDHENDHSAERHVEINDADPLGSWLVVGCAKWWWRMWSRLIHV
jgi:hypothetical protein